MKINEALEHIIVSAVFHIHNMMLRDSGTISVSTELLRFVKSQGYEQLDKIIPSVTFEDVEQWARNYAYSIYLHKQLIPQDADTFAILSIFKNTLPQVYDDLVLRGEVLEARLRVDVPC